MKCKPSRVGGLLVDSWPPHLNGLIGDLLYAGPNGVNRKLVHRGEDLGRDPIRDAGKVP